MNYAAGQEEVATQKERLSESHAPEKIVALEIKLDQPIHIFGSIRLPFFLRYKHLLLCDHYTDDWSYVFSAASCSTNEILNGEKIKQLTVFLSEGSYSSQQSWIQKILKSL